MPDCGDGKIVLANGECEICPDYHFVSEDKKKCTAAACGEREVAQKDGSCV
jgi:hypothetical protein